MRQIHLIFWWIISTGVLNIIKLQSKHFLLHPQFDLIMVHLLHIISSVQVHNKSDWLQFEQLSKTFMAFSTSFIFSEFCCWEDEFCLEDSCCWMTLWWEGSCLFSLGSTAACPAPLCGATADLLTFSAVTKEFSNLSWKWPEVGSWLEKMLQATSMLGIIKWLWLSMAPSILVSFASDILFVPELYLLTEEVTPPPLYLVKLIYLVQNVLLCL